jgi:hypothetical protein
MNNRAWLVVALLIAPAVGQKTSLTVTQNQDPTLACDLQVFFDSSDPTQRALFVDSKAPGAQLGNYRL